MNRRQKIIITVTGIFIALLALLGLTFAYFLTQIRGNEETKSISVTTANLILEYGDGNNAITLNGLMPGVPIPTKTFTVTNKGNATVNNYKVYLESVQNQLELKDDLKYTLTCKSYKTTDTTLDFSTLTEDGTCTGATSTTFPSVMNLITTNTINVGYTHRYELKVEYLYQEFDQSIDMNKLVQAKVNIYDEKTKFLATEIMNNATSGVEGRTVYTLPNELPTKIGEEGSYTNHTGEYIEVEEERVYEPKNYFYWTYDSETDESIMNNVSKCTDDLIGRWIYDLDENFMPVEVVRCEGETPIYKITSSKEILNTEKTLSYTYDDLGTSYYYRGNVEDNYVNFAGMCWRIVRIEGDGSIKLILEDQDQLCDSKTTEGNYVLDSNWNIKTSNEKYNTGHFGYIEDTNRERTMENYYNLENASSMSSAFNNFQKKLSNNELSKLKSGNWCYNDTAYSREDGRKLTKEEKINILNITEYDYNIPGYGWFDYDTFMRIDSTIPKYTLKCNGTVMNDWQDKTTNSTPMYVGTLTADEMAYAGAKLSHDTIPDDYNSGDYEEIGTTIHYLTKNTHEYRFSWWTLSPAYYIAHMGVSRVYLMHFNGNITDDYGTYGHSFRPSIILKSDSVVTTNPDTSTFGLSGTRTNPYVIN